MPMLSTRIVAENSRSPAPSQDAQRQANVELRTNAKETKVLAVIDNSEQSRQVVDYLINLAERGFHLIVVLLNIQPKPNEWQTRGLAKEAIHDRLINHLGKGALASAHRYLDAAGIEASDRIELGEPVPTIIRCADEEQCDMLVLSAEPLSFPRKWLTRKTRVTIGSVSAEVVQLAEVPVVVVTRPSFNKRETSND